MKTALVLGATGFLAGHLERRLKDDGYYVVSVARKLPPFRKSVADEWNILDLTNPPEFHHHFFRHNYDVVFQMAGEVGGLGYIADADNDADILTNSLKINLATLESFVKTEQAGKLFFASSQCVYPSLEPVDPFASERIPLSPTHACREEDAQFGPLAFAQEKLFAENLYSAFARRNKLKIAIARLGNTYGPYGTWFGARAKAPAAICRKVAEAEYGAPVKLWGDGNQTRSFMYVDDAIEGIMRLVASDYDKPLNIGCAHMVTIRELFDAVCKAAGKILAFEPVDGPVGVRARTSDNTLCKKVLDWEPTTPLDEGIKPTYKWIAEQVQHAHKIAS